MRPCVLLWYLGYASGLVVGSSSPPVSVSIESAWPAPDLLTQYLETVALEQPHHLFPFLAFLASNPTSHHTLDPPLLPTSRVALERFERVGINPVFAPPETLHPNETLALLEHAATESRLFRGKGIRQSMQLTLALRETSVVIEVMRTLWASRKAEVIARDSKECESWIDVDGQVACSVDDFWEIVGHSQSAEKAPITFQRSLPSTDPPRSYSTDHVAPPGHHPSLPRVVFYACPASPEFQHLFAFLYELSTPKPVVASGSPSGTVAPHPPRLQFIMRWKPARATTESGQHLVLAGYGAALNIKKSDYLTIDDRMSASNGAGGAGPRATMQMAPVHTDDIPDLSLRAAQYILSSNSSFRAFTSLASSFPLLASRLSTLVPEISPGLVSDASKNSATFSPAVQPAFWLNGVLLTEAQVDPFALTRLMRQERKFVTDMQGLSAEMTGRMAREILMNGQSRPAAAKETGLMPVEALGELFDATDRLEDGHVTIWWNDLEKDKQYKSWPRTVRDLLRPTYPGSMNLVARNLNNVIFLLDLSDPASLTLVARNLKQFIGRGIPLRFGLVPLVASADDSIETKMAVVTHYLVDTVGRGPAIRFLQELHEASPKERITEDLLRRAYARTFLQSQTSENGSLAPIDAVLERKSESGESPSARLTSTRKYLERLGIPLADGVDPAPGSFFLNGAYFPIDEEFSQNLQKTLGLHSQFLQQEVYVGSLTDEHVAETYFADLPSTYERRNPFVFASADVSPLKVVNLQDAYDGVMPEFVDAFYIESASSRARVTDVVVPAAVATLTIITDVNEPGGMALVKAAMHLAHNNSVRVSLLHNPIEHYEAHPWALSNILYLLHRYDSFEELLPAELIAWIDLGLTVGGPLPRHGRDWAPGNPLRSMLNAGVEASQSIDAQFFWEELHWLVSKFGFKPGQNGIILNGRVIGPFPDTAFAYPDLRVLLAYELDKRINPIVSAVEQSGLNLSTIERSQVSTLYNLASSIVLAANRPDAAAGLFGRSIVERRRDYLSREGNCSSIVSAHDDDALYEVAVVIDPATEVAQRWAPIIETLAALDTVHLRLYLNPAFGLSDVPIKRFYNFVFPKSPLFDPSTGQEIQPSIRFDGIPEDTLLTFAIDTNQAWSAFPRSSMHDLDNIRLEDLHESSRNEGVTAVLELDSLIVEGHARETPTSRAPRGLQLELLNGLKTDSALFGRADTIVMANLGYFQFKASPGVWRLSLRRGKSAAAYEIESTGVDGWKSTDINKTGDTLVVSTLEGMTLYPRFRRRPGHELTELLDEPSAPRAGLSAFQAFVSQLRSMVPSLRAKHEIDLVATPKKADINVFTVASGLLYERMAFLMVVSVLRHTESTVKFWFIENFLSPSFKAFIPHMAREYNFDYELVTYKWPHWLRSQQEKQRTIWGYKILFLDVLFPLELDRVIFVDSDQIVRTDLQELMDLDLDGCAYGFAPMGNDREETKGYRFWEHGYWKQHLDGRPYHISALYVVDLDRFRQIAAGDRLRQQYQALTADPASLANLDQDLPNNMQSTLPIYTLDRSWLWCETWCSDESLAEAKTIDLCNNPKTKEQKLTRARRLIPEWTIYDDEVAALARRVASNPTTIASERNALVAFGARADELEQAVQQRKERDEVLEEVERQTRHVKDEL